MHNSENCHENVWILSGTSDGPVIVDKLLKLNYVVFVSVVTHKASKSYVENSKLHIITGKLNDSSEIINFIEKNKINYVIDATHPFALIISQNLDEACKKIKKPLLAFLLKITSYHFYKQFPPNSFVHNFQNLCKVYNLSSNDHIVFFLKCFLCFY